jgi:hypothetical protein
MVIKQSWLRWGLAGLLLIVSTFFLITGFSIALLGEGAEPGDIRQAWRYQAAFRLSITALLWVISVLLFVSLRPGGLVSVVRGKQITTFKRWLYIASLIASIAAFLLSDPRVLFTRFKIYQCEKNGGSWAYLSNGCK